MRKSIIFASMALLTLPAMGQAKKLILFKEHASAAIIDARGVPVGTAIVVKPKKRDALQISIDVNGLSPGEHGIHIHMIGLCESPKFASAGGHWNPMGKMHGMNNANGNHSGDLPNLLVNAKGRGKLKFEIAKGQFAGNGGLMDDDGSAIVIHAQTDDQRTDPSGNSGDRIACGVFVKG